MIQPTDILWAEVFIKYFHRYNFRHQYCYSGNITFEQKLKYCAICSSILCDKDKDWEWVFKQRINHNIDQLFKKYFDIIPKKDEINWYEFHNIIEKQFNEFKNYQNYVVQYKVLDDILLLDRVRVLFHDMPKHGFIYLLDFKSIIHIEEIEFLKSLVQHYVLMILHYCYENSQDYIKIFTENKIISPFYAKDVISISFQFLTCFEQSICLDNNITYDKKELRSSVPDLKFCSNIRNSF